MNKEKQRIAIAEACGLKQIRTINGMLGYPVLVYGGDKTGRGKKSVPDYPNDLNAMHEAEKTLNWENQKRFGRTLWKIVEPSYRNINEGTGPFRLAHASAAERAEAFLKTLNLWKA